MRFSNTRIPGIPFICAFTRPILYVYACNCVHFKRPPGALLTLASSALQARRHRRVHKGRVAAEWASWIWQWKPELQGPFSRISRVWFNSSQVWDKWRMPGDASNLWEMIASNSLYIFIFISYWFFQAFQPATLPRESHPEAAPGALGGGGGGVRGGGTQPGRQHTGDKSSVSKFCLEFMLLVPPETSAPSPGYYCMVCC